jgi:hypothetical protein
LTSVRKIFLVIISHEVKGNLHLCVFATKDTAYVSGAVHIWLLPGFFGGQGGLFPGEGVLFQPNI